MGNDMKPGFGARGSTLAALLAASARASSDREVMAFLIVCCCETTRSARVLLQSRGIRCNVKSRAKLQNERKDMGITRNQEDIKKSISIPRMETGQLCMQSKHLQRLPGALSNRIANPAARVAALRREEDAASSHDLSVGSPSCERAHHAHLAHLIGAEWRGEAKHRGT